VDIDKQVAAWWAWGQAPEWSAALDRAWELMAPHWDRGLCRTWLGVDAVAVTVVGVLIVASRKEIAPRAVTTADLLALFPEASDEPFAIPRRAHRVLGAGLIEITEGLGNEVAVPVTRLWQKVLLVDKTPSWEQQVALAEETQVRWGLAVSEGAAAAWVALRDDARAAV
jgi:hypothetical protein